MKSIERWIRLTRGLSVAGFAVYASATIALPEGTQLSSLFHRWVYPALMVFACVVVGSRAILVARERAAWVVFTVGVLSWTFGEIWWAATHPETYPSAADYGYLGFYPAVYVGMVLLLRARARSIGGTLWLDGLTASVAAAALGAAILVEVVLDSTQGSTSTVVTNLAYPTGDLLLLSVVFGAFSLARWRPGLRWLVLGLGLLSTAFADSIYLFQAAQGTYVEGTWLDVFWPAAMLLVAGAAWTGDRAGPALDVGARPLLAVPALAGLVAIAILVYDHFERQNLLALSLATAALVLVVVRLAVTFRENRRLLELTRSEATTDVLTGLGNRRKLISDLEGGFGAESRRGAVLMIFDLDGFKGYNDTFGHSAGDALLVRLGAKLAEVLEGDGDAYRLGGDEFCVVASVAPDRLEELIDRAGKALTERGEGFEVESSFGAVLIPEEAGDVSEALRIADERLYAQKATRRDAGDLTVHAFLEALRLPEADLQEHLEGVGSIAVETGRRLGLNDAELDDLRHAARLHDIGKLAVPAEILRKDGPLEDGEWAFIRQHPIVGERLLRASAGLREVAKIVRSTHENWDGSGYPDGLRGDEIPLAARVIAACDAYDAMLSRRPYRRALEPRQALKELQRLAGSQFDPAVVDALVAHVRHELETEQAA